MPTLETLEKKAIKDWLDYNGWFRYHNMAGLGSYPGLPDITAAKDSIVLQIEVKAKNGKQSFNQKEFEGRWKTAGGHYICGGLDDVINYLDKIK